MRRIYEDDFRKIPVLLAEARSKRDAQALMAAASATERQSNSINCRCFDLGLPQTPTAWLMNARFARHSTGCLHAGRVPGSHDLPAPEGRSVRRYTTSGAALGRATFMMPVALVVTGVLLVIRALRPSVPLPWRRLVVSVASAGRLAK